MEVETDLGTNRNGTTKKHFGRIVTVLLAVALIATLATPALAAAVNLPSRLCFDAHYTGEGSTLVGIKSFASGTVEHRSWSGGPPIDVKIWQRGGTKQYNHNVTPYYHIYDSYGFGGQVRYLAKDYAYSYCTWYS